MKKVFSTATEINAPPEKIWAILTDGSKYVDWDPNMIRLEGQIAPGEQLSMHTKLDPNRAFTPKVVEFEPNRKMVWKSGLPFGLFYGARTFTLEPLSSGKTRFSMREEFDGLLLPFIGRSIPDLNASFVAFATALRMRAEKG